MIVRENERVMINSRIFEGMIIKNSEKVLENNKERN